MPSDLLHFTILATLFNEFHIPLILQFANYKYSTCIIIFAQIWARLLVTNEQLVIYPKHDKKSNMLYFCPSYQQDIKIIILYS